MRTRTTMTSGAPQILVGAFSSNIRLRKKLLSLSEGLRLCPYCERWGCSKHIRRCGKQLVKCSQCGGEVPYCQLDSHFFNCKGVEAKEDRPCDDWKVSNEPEVSDVGVHGTDEVNEGRSVTFESQYFGTNDSFGSQKKGFNCVVCDLLFLRSIHSSAPARCRGHVFECATCKQVFTTVVEYAMHLCCGRTDAEPRSTTGSVSQFDGMGRDANFKPAWETMCASLQPTERTTTPLSTLSQCVNSKVQLSEMSPLSPTPLRRQNVEITEKPRRKSSNGCVWSRDSSRRGISTPHRRFVPSSVSKGVADKFTSLYGADTICGTRCSVCETPSSSTRSCPPTIRRSSVVCRVRRAPVKVCVAPVSTEDGVRSSTPSFKNLATAPPNVPRPSAPLLRACGWTDQNGQSGGDGHSGVTVLSFYVRGTDGASSPAGACGAT